MDIDVKLLKCVDLLTEYHKLIDTCMVHFITDDLFKLIPQDLADELLTLSDEAVAHLPSLLFSEESCLILEGKNILSSTVNRIKSLLLDNLLEECKQIEIQPDEKSAAVFKDYDKIMPEKKTHEVELMSEYVNNLCQQNDAHFLVDLGSGKAYLSQVMGFVHKKRILAIDSEEINTKGADARQKNLSKKWSALELRAQERREGKAPTSRKQRLKANAQNGAVEKVATAEKDVIEDESNKVGNPVGENIKLSTKFISDDTDLGNIIESHYPDFSNKMGMMGLHTCGNLAPSSIKIFFATSSAKFLCNVGCCYHGLEEEFYRNPYLKADEEPSLAPGFPMSAILKERKFWLGRNARILASQPLGRLADNKNLPSHSLIWRAMLQVLMLQVKPDLSFHDQQVGRIAAKSLNFVDYVHRAFKKLSIDLPYSDEYILEFYDTYQPKYQQKLNCFYQIRSLFAPIVEGIIMLDRLLFISENHCVKSCRIVRLFEPAISPRCYAIVASKA